MASGLAALANARINGIAVPDTIRPGEGFNAIIRSSNYIQTVFDVAIVFGYHQGPDYPPSLGSLADSLCLGADQSNQLNDFKKWVFIPSSAPKGPGTVTASLMSLYGASHTPVLASYSVNVTFGDFTSNNYVGSQP
ncbi:hypothetical protein CDD82_1745 [Ophiocordyceps australis]|uniref:Uncharacterized protein n=1 Tax=Ophiocordyceps australis TaxID=1399860 RepID=A0A2C5XJB7_9HYPO|nr:hypothetical protein CDD82_1745 [Ophiocordyceps australis]